MEAVLAAEPIWNFRSVVTPRFIAEMERVYKRFIPPRRRIVSTRGAASPISPSSTSVDIASSSVQDCRGSSMPWRR